MVGAEREVHRLLTPLHCARNFIRQIPAEISRGEEKWLEKELGFWSGLWSGSHCFIFNSRFYRPKLTEQQCLSQLIHTQERVKTYKKTKKVFWKEGEHAQVKVISD